MRTKDSRAVLRGLGRGNAPRLPGGLARSQEQYKTTGKHPTTFDLEKQLNALKQTDFPWMYEVSKYAPQSALQDLEDAFKHFFRRWRAKKAGTYKGKLGFPRYKSKKKGLGSFRLAGNIYICEDAIQLPRLGRLRLKERGYLPTSGVNILSATISEQAGRWYVSVQVEEHIPNPEPATGPVIGVDLGIKTLATLSDEIVFENPKALRSRLKALKRAHRRLSRRKKGSNNRKKAQRKLARLHARVANIRQDAIHKATSAIVAKTKPQDQRPRVIAIEDLNVSGMLKNHCLAQAVADAGFYEFRRQLTYKVERAGSMIFVVNRWYPSSKTCSCCGWVWEDMTLKDRVFVCQNCGYVADRDYNGAKNLAAAVLPDYGQPNSRTTVSFTGIDACGQDVRPEQLGNPG